MDTWQVCREKAVCAGMHSSRRFKVKPAWFGRICDRMTTLMLSKLGLSKSGAIGASTGDNGAGTSHPSADSLWRLIDVPAPLLGLESLLAWKHTRLLTVLPRFATNCWDSLLAGPAVETTVGAGTDGLELPADLNKAKLKCSGCCLTTCASNLYSKDN